MAVKIEPFYTDVGQRIRTWRSQRGLTQEQLGRALIPPMTRVSVANIEAGNQRILSHTLVQIAAALNVEIVDILPKKSSPSSNDAQDLTDELASKLGISKADARKIADKAKRS
jgi:transcriptional regulator with XRE-family HTH domain